MRVRTLGPEGGGLSGPLQIVSEPDTGRCVSLLAVPRRGVDTRRCASKDAGPKGGWIWRRSHIDWRKERVPARTLGPEGGWIVMSHINWGREQITIYKGVDTFPLQTRFKALRGTPKGKAQREQYLLAVDLDRYIITHFLMCYYITSMVKKDSKILPILRTLHDQLVGVKNTNH